MRLADHLEAVRLQDLKDVWAFWSGGEAPDLPRSEIVRQLADAMSDEGTVYRRVRTLTRKVLDVLLVLVRRPDYRSDLPGLFRRVGGEEGLALEYHEAEAALKALVRRGFAGEWTDRFPSATQARALYAVPAELGDLLSSLFREETRTVRSVFSLAGFVASLGATDRRALGVRFPALGAEAGPEDAAAVLAGGGGAGRLEAVEPEGLRDLAFHALAHGGLLLRADAAGAAGPAWDRRGFARALEGAGAGTVARLALGEYGIACEDEALVLFHEVVEDLLRARTPADPECDEVLRPGGDLVADMLAFLGEVRQGRVRLTREGDVHRAAQRRIEEGFAFRETGLAGRQEVWGAIRWAVDHLGLVGTDREGFLAPKPEADRWATLPLDAKVSSLHRLALEAPGPRGRSLHLCEMRQIVCDLLREEPRRWWAGNDLFVVARMRYLATLDARKIRERHRDRHFAAYVATREAPRDLLLDLSTSWRRTLYLLGLVDVALRDDAPAALRLSALGARVLGVPGAGGPDPVRSVLVTPDFEVVVLPEGDAADAVHYLGGFAQRVRSGDVVHFRLTKDSVETATAEGRRVADLLAWLAERARGPVPRNVAVSLEAWAAGVTFATLERGVVLRIAKPGALDAVLSLPGLQSLLLRRLSPTEALLKDEPRDRRLLAALRAEGVYLEPE